MPDIARVHGQGSCPSCGDLIVTEVRCQWGVCPAQYQVGDSVDWLRDDQDRILPPFKLRQVAPNRWYWNCGEPQFSNVILFDVLFDADVFTQACHCPNCKGLIAATVAEVREGKFGEIRALDNAEVDRILGKSRGKTDIVIVRDDGTLWPREDWYDHPIELLE